MNSTPLLPWGTAYVAVALLFAVASLVVADHLCTGEPPSVLTRGWVASVSGALWPVMLLGLAQLWLIRTVATIAHPAQHRRAESATTPPHRLVPAA